MNVYHFHASHLTVVFDEKQCVTSHLSIELLVTELLRHDNESRVPLDVVYQVMSGKIR